MKPEATLIIVISSTNKRVSVVSSNYTGSLPYTEKGNRKNAFCVKIRNACLRDIALRQMHTCAQLRRQLEEKQSLIEEKQRYRTWLVCFEELKDAAYTP